MKITCPDQSYSGESRYGDSAVTFTDGVALVDGLPESVLAYMVGAGYAIESDEPEAESDDEPEAETPKPTRRRTAKK